MLWTYKSQDLQDLSFKGIHRGRVCVHVLLSVSTQSFGGVHRDRVYVWCS
jgi:hypothetical protein